MFCRDVAVHQMIRAVETHNVVNRECLTSLMFWVMYPKQSYSFASFPAIGITLANTMWDGRSLLRTSWRCLWMMLTPSGPIVNAHP